MPANGALNGAATDRLMLFDLSAMLVLFLLAHLLLAVALTVKHRRPSPAGAKHAWSKIWLVEALPLLTISALFVWMTVAAERLWAAQRFVGPAPGALQVEVVGVQFQWYFRYPGPDAEFGRTRPQLVNAAAGNPLGLDSSDTHAADDVVSSVLMLPADREVDLTLRALDVIHGLFIPGMRVKQNAVPGLVLHVHFTPQTPGTYPILCTQVCGSGHARMQAVLRVVSPAAYDAWLQSREQRLRLKEVRQ
jgi:cytochrome c oxidase subunit 2